MGVIGRLALVTVHRFDALGAVSFSVSAPVGGFVICPVLYISVIPRD